MVERTYYPNGLPYIVEDRVNGKRNGKVLIYNSTGQEINTMTYSDGQICYFAYYQNGIRHNLHGPAHMEWYDNLQVCYISYWQNGIRHNLHGPAHMVWYDNGQINWISCCQNGVSHNLHGPAYMEWFRSNNKICDITYWQNNELHNLHGPAFIHCSSNDKSYRIEYYHFNKLIKEYRFLNVLD